jgi:hypothetical protein
MKGFFTGLLILLIPGASLAQTPHREPTPAQLDALLGEPGVLPR